MYVLEVALQYLGTNKIMPDKPGMEFAEQNGYHLHSYSGADKDGIIHSANYMKDNLCLTIRSDNSASLSKILGMVECKIDDFGIPNKNFKSFESQLYRVVQVSYE
jgi:hypothetical protein